MDEIKPSRRLPVISIGKICVMIFATLSHSVINVRELIRNSRNPVLSYIPSQFNRKYGIKFMFCSVTDSPFLILYYRLELILSGLFPSHRRVTSMLLPSSTILANGQKQPYYLISLPLELVCSCMSYSAGM